MGLFDFLKYIPTPNEMVGGLGEWLAKLYAKTMPGALVLHDVLIPGKEQYTSQIDLVVIGNRGIYTVEVKMYAEAKIYGDTRKAKWYYYSHGHKYDVYSPIKQNQKHVEYLKTFLKDFGEVPCYSIVAMICDDFKLSGEYPADTIVCSSLPAMERAIYKIAENKPEIWDDEQKKAIFEYIKEHQYTGKAARIEHKEQVIAYKTEQEQKEQKRLCPYCKLELILRSGKYGKFYGCPNYPKCKYTLKAEEAKNAT